MAAKCGKCDPHEICEECPEWIFTLADLIMCMMGLFVLLWVLKPSPSPNAGQPNDEEWIKVAAAVRESFGYEPDPAKTDDRVNTYLLMKKIHAMNPDQGPGKGGQTQLKPDGAKGTDPEVTTIRPGQQALVGGRITFAQGTSDLSPDTVTQVKQIAAVIRGHRNIVLVKGHASLDDHADDATAETRMDLSLRRAQAVADVLMGQGVSPDILRVQGCSTFEPVAQRAYTLTSVGLNRRVEVEATATLVSDRQDKPRLP
jgi:outer membrane protein OmpA-like peptidoglycan-associated protein